MTRQERIEDLFAALWDLPKAEQLRALERLDEPDIRLELESLLRHAAVPGETVAAAPAVIGEAIQAASTAGRFDPRLGCSVGHYRIERLIGQGGMGDVYEAVREDDFLKLVAVKVMRRGLDADAAYFRFQQERQLLASLEHPNIARLLDGGESGGCLYLVLEFVEGVPVDQYCRGQSREQILNLFLKVCSAVNYAHRAFVVHRDLKPANILVTRDGEPKLLDFGLAKLANPNGELKKTFFPGMTPQYASPEQVMGGLVTTATDVHALGLILYELLTGQRVYSFSESTPSEISRVVCKTDPAPPGVSADLDNIVMKAIHKDPERRYGSVQELAEDIKRSMNHLPVHARPDSFAYRASKFVRRNFGAVGAGLALFLAVSAGIASTLYQARIARQRFEQVRKLAHTFVFDVHDEIAKVDGNTAARQLVVKTALEYLDQLNASAGGDLGLQEELASAYEKIASAQGNPHLPNLGQKAAALANYAKAEKIYESLAAKNPEKRLELGKFESRYGGVLRGSGDIKNAEVKQRRGMTLMEPFAGRSGAVQLDFVLALASFANLQEEALGDPAASAETRKKAASIIEGVLERSRTLEAIEAAQAVQGGLTGVRDLGRLTEALQAADKQQRLLGELLKMDPSRPSFKRALTLSFQVTSVIYYDDFSPSLMDPIHGAEHAERYLARARESVSSDPRNFAARFTAAIAESRLAACLRFVRPAEAVGHARAALAAITELHRQSPGFLTETRLPGLKRILAESLIENRSYSLAVPLSEETVAENRALAAKYPSEYVVAFNLITSSYTAGKANHKAGRLDAARKHLQSAFELAEDWFSRRRTSLEFTNIVRKVAEARADCAASSSEKDHWTSLAANAWQRYTGGPNEFADRHQRP